MFCGKQRRISQKRPSQQLHALAHFDCFVCETLLQSRSARAYSWGAAESKCTVGLQLPRLLFCRHMCVKAGHKPIDCSMPFIERIQQGDPQKWSFYDFFDFLSCWESICILQLLFSSCCCISSCCVCWGDESHSASAELRTAIGWRVV